MIDRPARRQLGRGAESGLWAVPVAVGAGGLANLLLPHATSRTTDPIVFALWAAVTVLFGGVGALVVTRQPGNLVGWLLWIIGVLAGVSVTSAAYATWSTTSFDGSLPGTVPAAWINQWMLTPTFVLGLLFLPLLFPDGRLPSRRWRWALAFALLTTVALGLHDMLQPGPLGTTGIPNPTGWTGDPALLAVLDGFNSVSPLLALPIVVASAVVRYRRGRTVERQQLKWFGATAAFAMVGLSIAILTPEPIAIGGFLVAVVALALLPVAIGIAILRYRLYEIDHLVSRTISYAVVTAVLVGVFAGAILLFGTALAPLTGKNTIAVAASTLVVAALFQPLRRRVQRVVDRRFNRARYDAERTIADFAERLRDQVELDALVKAIVETTGLTVAPASTSVWIRDTGASS